MMSAAHAPAWPMPNARTCASPHPLPTHHRRAGGRGAARLNHQALNRLIESSRDRPLITLQVVRSYAAASPQHHDHPHPNHLHPQPHQGQAGMGRQDSLGGMGPYSPSPGRTTAGSLVLSPGGPNRVTIEELDSPGAVLRTSAGGMVARAGIAGGAGPSTGGAAGGTAGGTGQQAGAVTGEGQAGAGILSFKKVDIDVGPLDFMTDQHFLEAVYVYVQTLPVAEVWQDARWRDEMEQMQVRVVDGGVKGAR